MIEKKYIFAIIFIILFIILVIVNITYKPSVETDFENYLIKLGYKSEGDTNLYYKLLSNNDLKDYLYDVDKNIESNFEINYFDTDGYFFEKNIRKFEKNIDTSLKETYDYKDSKVTYEYRIVYEDNLVVLEGVYFYSDNSDSFTCDYSYNDYLDNDNKDICSKIKYDVKDFYYEALELIKDSKLTSSLIKEKK